MRAKRQLERFDTAAFLAKNPVFTLEDLRRALGGAKGRRAALERVKYYLKRGKLKPVSRGVYAAVPGLLYVGKMVIFTPFRWRRMATFINPWADQQGSGYQVVQSLIAVGLRDRRRARANEKRPQASRAQGYAAAQSREPSHKRRALPGGCPYPPADCRD